MQLVQLGFSVLDRERSRDWYSEILGYVPAGGFSAADSADAEEFSGLPGIAFEASWLVDREDFFQLEIFAYSAPEPRRLPSGWRPCDIGYSMATFHVEDFDAVLSRLSRQDPSRVIEPVGNPHDRSVCVRDHDGILVELRERDPRGAMAPSPARRDVPVAMCSVTLSVPDLSRSRDFFVEALGLQEASDIDLHQPYHEEQWGLSGAVRRETVLWAGTAFIELVQYVEPRGQARPEDYRLSDRGILNLALGTRSFTEVRETVERVRRGGFQTGKTLGMPIAEATYVTDDQGFTVELLAVTEEGDSVVGFTPADPAQKIHFGSSGGFEA